MVTENQLGHSKDTSASGRSSHDPFPLGSFTLSVFFAVIDISAASLTYYAHREFLYWLISPSLLLLAALSIFRAMSIKRQIQKAGDFLKISRETEAQETWVRLTRLLVDNLTYGMYGIGTAMLLVIWLSQSHR
jgi:hypothetical protein